VLPAPDSFRIQLLHPLKPRLAGTAKVVTAALEALGTAGLEYKLD